MTTDFRALCAELVEKWDNVKGLDDLQDLSDAMERARAALSAPEQGPSEAELKTFACKWWHSFGFVKDKATCGWVIDSVAPEHFADFSRDVLARWGRPAVEPTDEQILAIQDRAVASFSPVHPDAQNLSAIEYAKALEIRKARAVLQHLDRPAVDATNEEWFANFSEWLAREMPAGTVIGDPEWWAPRIAAELLTIATEMKEVEPVPVAERLPGSEDCDDQGRCWWLDRPLKNGPAAWMLRRPDDGMLIPFIAWAPHWAFPVPQEGADG
jgi:hypothetical protein